VLLLDTTCLFIHRTLFPSPELFFLTPRLPAFSLFLLSPQYLHSTSCPAFKMKGIQLAQYVKVGISHCRPATQEMYGVDGHC
jgi:hypothetical protein